MTVQAQRSKRLQIKPVDTLTSSAATQYTSALTHIGFDYAVIDVVTGPAAATNTSAKWTSLQLNHGTTTDVSNSTAVPGPFIGTTNATATTSQFVLPEHNDTANESTVRFYVDLRHLEPFLGIQGQQDNSSSGSTFVCELWRGEGMGDTASERGVEAMTEG